MQYLRVCKQPADTTAMGEESPSEPVDAVMAASRVLVGLVAASVAEVASAVTVPQLRVLVMAADHSPLTLGNVARGLGVHASNATRTCDRLVSMGLLDRRDDPGDRRQLQLSLTRKGRRLVDSVLEHRRRAIEGVVAQMDPGVATQLGAALREFVAAAGKFPGQPSVAVPGPELSGGRVRPV